MDVDILFSTTMSAHSSVLCVVERSHLHEDITDGSDGRHDEYDTCKEILARDIVRLELDSRPLGSPHSWVPELARQRSCCCCVDGRGGNVELLDA